MAKQPYVVLTTKNEGKRDVWPETYRHRHLGPEARTGMHGHEITTRAEVGTNDVLARTAQNLADSFAENCVHPVRAAAASVVLCGVQYVSIVVPASGGQVVSVANLAAAGPLHMTLLPSSQCAAGHTLQHRWAFTSTSFGHYRDIQAFPEAAQATALICRPLLERPPPEQDTTRTAHKRLRRSHSAPVLSGRQGVLEERASMPPPPGQEAEHHVKTALQRLNLDGDPRQVPENGRQAKRPDATAAQPRVIGALLIGLDGSNRRPRKSDVEQLSDLLGPLIAPLAGKAVDVASAAYLARKLSRLSAEALPATHAPDRASPTKTSDSIQRMASDSWVLSTGEHALLRQLLEDSSLTKPSISEPWGSGDSSPMMSPLMSSMLVASRSSSGCTDFTFTPHLPLIDTPAGSKRGESILPRGRQRSRSEDSPRSSKQGSLKVQPRPVPTPNSAEPQTRLFRSANVTPIASLSSSPEHFGRTILLGPDLDLATTIAPVSNPFASGGSRPVGSEAPPPAREDRGGGRSIWAPFAWFGDPL
ncbi:hypothetical protein COCOBI_09-5030 [Coccomyxa sp. Obi]|nr:hypothetical protein COCOBI_09-5030 [Coccomyxa sp. Obi]